MDLIGGVNFLTYVRPSGTLDLARLRQAPAQLATGVLALHGQHIIHRDLNLENGQDCRHSQVHSAGTGRRGKLTAACDWYAVGVMLYEALAGKAPFVGGSLQVLQAKQLQEAPALPASTGIPEDLASLTHRLVRRAPGERPDAREIVKAVALQGEAPTLTRQGSGPQLVGREQQLSALGESYRWLRKQRQPVSVFFRGRSGEGKTSLAEHFLEPLRKEEVAVMSGRCYDRESVPFKALDSLIDALASYLRSLPETDAALLIPDDIGMLVQVFPVLQRVNVVAKATGKWLSELDEQQVRQRGFRALRALLTHISRGSPSIPVTSRAVPLAAVTRGLSVTAIKVLPRTAVCPGPVTVGTPTLVRPSARSLLRLTTQLAHNFWLPTGGPGRRHPEVSRRH